jgi:DNA polymerase-3 subunit alpha
MDGVASPKALAEHAKKLGFPGLCLTDHGNIFGAIPFFQACKEQEIKCGIGIEGYVSKERKTDGREKLGHIVLIAKNHIGYQNLVKIVSDSFDHFYYKPRMALDVIARFSEGIICSTACLHGLIARDVYSDKANEAIDTLARLKNIFKDDLYVEVMETGVQRQADWVNLMLEMAKKFNIKPIISNDVHYLNKSDAEIQDALLALQFGTHILDRKRGVVYGEWPEDENKPSILNSEYYMKTRADLEKFATNIPKEAFDNTMEIYEKLEDYNIEFKMGKYMPELPKSFLPVGITSNDEYLKHLAYDGLKIKGIDTQEYRDRLEYELGVISKLNFSSYFLILGIVIKEVRKRDILVGPGRGSAGGSLVLYALGISGVDPVKYRLMFERFLNPDRIDLPDVDIDFEQRRRQEVVDIVQSIFGSDKVSRIAIFNNMTTKLVIREALRAIEPNRRHVEELIKDLGALDELEPKELFEETANRQEEVIISAMDKMRAFKSPRVGKSWFDFASGMSGNSKAVSIHASGVIISKDRFSDIIPTFRVNMDSESALMCDMYIASKIGLVKFDLLGLTTLDIIKIACEMIKENHGVDIDPYALPFDDEKTFALLQAGNTCRVFQAEGDGFTNMLKGLKPTEFEHIIAMNALYRPGALAYDEAIKMSMAEKYIKTKNGLMPPTKIDPCIDDVLAPTHYMMLFQEQIMEIAQRVAGYSMAEADHLRKVIGKKLVKEVDEEGNKFVACSIRNGKSKEFAEYIFGLIKPSARYLWNRAHSAAYGVITYITAFLKANYPVEFMCANLIMSDTEQHKIIIADCKKLGIKISRPNINKSKLTFSASGDTIYIGLSSIKGIGTASAAALIKEREKNGAYKSFADFINRNKSVPSNQISQLALASGFAFDEDINRKDIVENISEIKKYVRAKSISPKMVMGRYATANEFDKPAYKKAVETGLLSLDLPPDFIYMPQFKKQEEYDLAELLEIESDIIGLLDVDLVLDMYQPMADAIGAITLKKALSLPPQSVVYVYGINGGIEVIYPKKDQTWQKFGSVAIIDKDGLHQRNVNVNTEDLDDKIVSGINYGCIKTSLTKKFTPVILKGIVKYSSKRGKGLTLVGKPLLPQFGIKVKNIGFMKQPSMMSKMLINQSLGDISKIDILTRDNITALTSVVGSTIHAVVRD